MNNYSNISNKINTRSIIITFILLYGCIIPLSAFSTLRKTQSHNTIPKIIQQSQNNLFVNTKISSFQQQNSNHITKFSQKNLPITTSSNQKLITKNSPFLPANITKQQLQLGINLVKSIDQPLTSDLSKKQKEYYQTKYQISQYAEQPFCIVIPSYNNIAQQRYLRNIISILQQDYQNYHIIFIDDASDDGTGNAIVEFKRQHHISDQKLKIVINTQRQMAMPNLRKAALQYCKPYQIFLIVDGDDQLVGKQVLKLFNSQFQSTKSWVIYSNFITLTGKYGFSRPYPSTIIQNNQFRKYTFVISHLRAFYTKLFTLIKQKDLKDKNNNWFNSANDVAMYLPILQMSHNKIKYISQLCYLYNSNTGLNNHRIKHQQQKYNQRYIKNQIPYHSIYQLFNIQEKYHFINSLNQKIPIKNYHLISTSSPVKVYG